MPAELLDGKALAGRIQHRISDEVRRLGFSPKLAVVLVGDNPASQVYVSHKQRACEKVGFESVVVRLPADSTQEDVEYAVNYWCHAPSVAADGVLVQLPLPHHLNRNRILNAVDPVKDVDCFHAENVGKLIQGGAVFKPCTPSGIIRLLKEYNIPTKGKKVTIVNRSMVVGMPLSVLLTHEGDATVTVCHEHSDVPAAVEGADIVVTAVGKYPEYHLRPEWVKPGAVVIDVGINRTSANTIMGDVVDYAGMCERASHVTPVPGGVGPLTVAYLLKNTLTAAKLSKGIK